MDSWQAFTWGVAAAAGALLFLSLVANEIACVELLVERHLRRLASLRDREERERVAQEQTARATEQFRGAQEKLVGKGRTKAQPAAAEAPAPEPPVGAVTAAPASPEAAAEGAAIAEAVAALANS